MKKILLLNAFFLQLLLLCAMQPAYAQSAFINEIHYDNSGGDVGEGIEVAGPAGTDLAGYSLVLYNGNGGGAYATFSLNGVIPKQDGNYGTLFFATPNLQNGSPDGVALVAANGSVLQFLSYEGAFTAVGGPANGLNSTDIGVAESSGSPADNSLQLIGTGTTYSSFSWQASAPSSYGRINPGQSFGGVVVEPEADTVDIATARSLPRGTEVIVCGVLTATDHFAGPAFIQDATGGIALFDEQVQATGLFQIGDSICVKATVGAFNQQVQLVNVSELDSYGTATAPISPKTISINELASVEGQLIRLEGVSFSDAGLLFPNSNYTITDGATTAQLRIDADVQSLVGKLIPEGNVQITGVVGSFRGSMQLLPRFEADLPAAQPYVAEGSDIAPSSTLDIATWNMEFFGATQNNFGPSNEALQLENAKKVLLALNADIIAVQEVSDEAFLAQLLSQLPGNWAQHCSDAYSYSYEPADPDFPAQKLCYIYNTDVVNVLEERVLFQEFYTTLRTSGDASLLPDYPASVSSFWASGRLPYLLKVQANVAGKTEELVLVNIHAISNGGGIQSYYRRAYDVQVLKDTLDAQYSNAQLVILGDYNDDVDEPVLDEAPSEVSPYAVFVNSNDYYVPTKSLSDRGFRSYITQDNVIDHITISTELSPEYIEGSEQVFIPFSLIPDFVSTTSDHMPVLVRFELFDPLVVEITGKNQLYAGYAPESCTSLAAQVSGGKGTYTYLWSTGETSASIRICPQESTTYTLTVFDEVGNSTTESFYVCVTDVACQAGKVQLCWLPSANKKVAIQLCLPSFLVNMFLQKGASLGSCFEESCTTEKAVAKNSRLQQPYEVRQLNINSLLEITPSLASEKTSVNFVVPEDGVTTVQLFSTAGVALATLFEQKAEAASIHSLELNISSLQPGMYLVKMSTASGEVFTQKFVVKH